MKRISWLCAVLLALAVTSASPEPAINGFYVGAQAGWERLKVAGNDLKDADEGWGGGVYVGMGKMVGDGYAALELEVNHSASVKPFSNRKQVSFGGHALLGVATDANIWYLRIGGMSTRFAVGREWDSAVAGGLGFMMPLSKPVSLRVEYLHKWFLDQGGLDIGEDIVRIGITYHL